MTTPTLSTQSLSVLDSNRNEQKLVTLIDPIGIERYCMSLDEPGAAVYRHSAAFTPQATGAVTVLTIQGSATKTVRIRRIMMGGVSTAYGATLFQMLRTNALGAGGTAVASEPFWNDSGTVADPTAVVYHYTTTAKAAGTDADGGPCLVWQMFTSNAPPTLSIPPMTDVFPGNGQGGQALVLRGTGEWFEIQNINGGNLPAGTVLNYMVEFQEDDS